MTERETERERDRVGLTDRQIEKESVWQANALHTLLLLGLINGLTGNPPFLQFR